MNTTTANAELVRRWQKRADAARQTLALKAGEAAKGHDWVVAHEVISCEDIIEIAAALEATASPVVTDAGLRAAIKFIEKRRDDYVAEHGIYDPETGATEFPGNGDETVAEWDELVEELQALSAALPLTAPPAQAHDIEAYYARQIDWSRETFGPALRTKGIIDHIRKELLEIEEAPHDLSEWIDVIILAMDGFWRHGGTAESLMPALLAKQTKNVARAWPDWRTMSEDRAIEHDRSGDQPTAPPARGQVEVKALEWRGSEGVWAKADALFGATYRITEYAGMAKPFKLETVGFVGPSGHYELLNEGKAAAQADYERRIRSALTSPAEPTSVGDWRIDKSTGTDILVFKDCSVIEGEQAHYLLRLIKAAEPAPATGDGDA